ncbi:DUF4145 domain-containing protein [Myxococcus sp. CA051A]|uniref:DUF4145 domain-containing protein n=1 Tax=Myxococcus sp. CA051A TaxID=2741739 RepID=UPI00157A3C9B|nr:DUF4145 domain-containing protein [Myxococcus sp. CA051A]NTX65939.1 DUF4145 domain-containing protein [Myxococcus sp. CA051A]
MPTEETISNPCNACERKTNHKILHNETHGVEGPDDYPDYMHYQIVQCLGCDTFSFRRHYEDYGSPVDNEDGTVSPSISTNTYPSFLKSRLALHEFSPVPEVVRAIFTETINATKEGALTLAGIGFRAVIEAICNDKGIPGKDLQKKISALAQKGMISKLEEKRLHSIRFLGNDAAHDIKRPSQESITTVLKITEHLIENIYTLDSEAQLSLETVIDQYDDFKTVLSKGLKPLAGGEEKSLSQILGKTIRRFVNSLPDMEKQLIAEIKSGTHPALSLGSLKKFDDRKHAVQLYIKK